MITIVCITVETLFVQIEKVVVTEGMNAFGIDALGGRLLINEAGSASIMMITGRGMK